MTLELGLVVLVSLVALAAATAALALARGARTPGASAVEQNGGLDRLSADVARLGEVQERLRLELQQGREDSLRGLADVAQGLQGRIAATQRIATYKAKWDDDYRGKWGIKNVFAGRLPNGVDKKIEDICKRAYRAIEMQSYARFDIRLSATQDVYIIEANANPSLFRDDEIAQSAEKAGISYDRLLEKIITFAFQRQPEESLRLLLNKYSQE